MKLAVLGGDLENSRHFIAYAKRQGYGINFASSITKAEDVIAESDVVVCLSDFTLDFEKVTQIWNHMQDYGVRRLLITSSTFDDLGYIQDALRQSSIDWTIVHTVEQAETLIDSPEFLVSAKQLTKFLVDQITDSRHLQSTVLVKA